MNKLDELLDGMDLSLLEHLSGEGNGESLSEIEIRRLHRITMNKIGIPAGRKSRSRRIVLALIAAVLLTVTVAGVALTSLGNQFDSNYYFQNYYGNNGYQGLSEDEIQLVNEIGNPLNLKQTVGKSTAKIPGVLADSKVAIIPFEVDRDVLHLVTMYYDDQPNIDLHPAITQYEPSGTAGKGHYAFYDPEFNRPITLKATLEDKPVEFHFTIQKKAPELKFLEDTEENLVAGETNPQYRNLTLSPVSIYFEYSAEITEAPIIMLKDGSSVPYVGFNGYGGHLNGDPRLNWNCYFTTLNLPLEIDKVKSVLIGGTEFFVAADSDE